jgi:ABC-type branched-subunit amino acid transport system substrate-binding protein
MDDANTLHQLGVEKTKGLVHFDQFSMPPPVFKNPGYAKFHKVWNNAWKKWKSPPFNSRNCEHGNQIRTFLMQTYWLMSVLERAKSTDPEKIIQVWEGDTYQYPNGKIVMMRACDHRSIQDFTVEEYVEPEQQKIAYNMPPYYWFKGAAYPGPGYLIPASKVFPRMDKNHDRCKGKNDWGE